MKTSIRTVLNIFWQGIRPQKWLFFFCISGFTVSNIILILVPLFYKRFFDTLTTVEDKALAAPQLITIISAIALFHAVVWILNQSATFANNKFESRTIARLKQLCFDYVLNHSYSFFANNFTGSLVQKINRFARAFESLSDSLLFHVIPLFINVVGTLIVVYFTNPLIALILIGWMGLFLVFNYVFSLWKLRHDLASAAADSKTNATLADTMTNHNTIALFTGFSFESKNFREVSNDQARKTRLTWDLSTFVDSVQVGLVFIVEFFLFYYSIRLWQQGVFSIGTFALLQVYYINLGNQLWGFSRLIRTVYQSFADSKEMTEILSLPHEVRDVPAAHPLTVHAGAIEYKNVSFSFNETRTVLNNVNLSIKPGEKIALIGPSGAGKSTFTRLLLRLYNLSGGTIFIDDQDIAHVTQESLREAIALVPQDPILFHRTLLENIRYGQKDATDDEVIAAAKLAHCDEFIDSLPLGYHTLVGERGIKLSGGERQRVAIARAILKNAPILVLDEATSSLDSHSEALIQDALDKLMKGKTSIVIAHRLSTIRKMDRIVVIKDGVIAEEGTHDHLLQKKGSIYHALWDLQAGGFLNTDPSTEGQPNEDFDSPPEEEDDATETKDPPAAHPTPHE